MTFAALKRGGIALCCLALILSVRTQALALDKRTSLAISHYIMAVVHEDLGDIDAAIGEYKKALHSDASTSAIHLNLASSYIKKNDLPKAIEELQQTIHLEPEAVEPHAILALIYSSQSKSGQAAAEYELALKNASRLEPKNIEIYRSLGSIYLQQNKPKEAEGVYKLILDFAPNDAQAHFYLANVYNELKNSALCEKELVKAIELKPDYAEALNYLGYLYVEADKGLDQAEVWIKKAIELDPENGAYIDSLGWLYFKKGDLVKSLQLLQKAGDLMLDAVIFEHLGHVYLKMNDPQNARLNWQKSLRINPKQEVLKKKLEALK